MTEREAEIEREAMRLLEEALDMPSDEQSAFIERAEVADEVRAYALDLLRSDRDDTAAIHTGGAGNSFGESEAVPPDLPGYRIVRLLGRGGMGTVWLAERTGADFEHRVAIKLIKPGILVEALVDRFRRERQILARLNHPNIAHLHDGGETADGQPYIVMEYIEGRSLRDWLAEKQPSLAQRLALFRQVALAVEFAHQNLVIHRDLTPNNVLVTSSEQAKLIDFGIARPQLTEGEQPAVSTISGLSLTPGFAAPERARGVASNTLTDIYSLGRILAFLTEQRGDPELAAIAARAAEEDPADRYASVSELLDDIECFERDRPVAVFSDSRTYRMRKFVAREKPLTIAVAAVSVALIGGMTATAWGYNRAERQRAVAEHRFDQLRDLARFQLFELYDELDSVVGNTEARLALADRAQKYLVELAESRSIDPQLQLETARGFNRLALIQGVPARPNFGEPEEAQRNLDRAEPIFTRLMDEGVHGASAGLATTHAYRALLFAHWENDTEQARASIDKAERTLSSVPRAQRDWDWMQARRAARLAALETADLELDSEATSRYADHLESDIAEWPAAKREGYEARFDRAVAENYHAVVLHNEGSPASLREGVRRYLNADRLFGELETDFPNDPQTLYRRAWNAYYGYAAAANAGDKLHEERLLSQARASAERLLTIEEADHSLVTFAERMKEAQAQFLSNSGRHREAIELQNAVVAGRVAKIRADRKTITLTEVAYGKALLGTIYRKAGEREGACRNWSEAEALLVELERREALQEWLGSLRDGVKANIARCEAGEPVSSFTRLDGR